MKKFLLGIFTGLVLAGLSVVVLIFSAMRIGERKPVVSDGSTLVLSLREEVPEKSPVSFPVPIPFIQTTTPVTVQEIWSTLRRASTDNRIRALVINLGRIDAGWAKASEIRDDILNFKKSGKPVYVFLKSPRMREYYIATAGDKIFASPEDLIDVKGIRAEVMYLKGTLDKIGVQMEVEHAGRFKDAGDMFTQTSMSPETKESLGKVLDGLYGSVVQGISSGRKKSVEEIRAVIDDGPYIGKKAVAKGLIDALRYEDQVFGDLKDQLKQGEIKKIGFKDYLRSLSPEDAKKRIAFIVGSGAILRGPGEDAMGSEEGFTSGAFIRMLQNVAKDSSIAGVILRVDSPGGDAIASDEILREVKLLRSKKPMIVSMSDYAASGGYYVAMSGDPVVAYPNTVTGSIGVVYAKPNLRGLYDKLGITKDFLLRGKNANIDTDYGPITTEGRAKLQEGINDVYSQFVTIVAEGRKRKYEEVEPLAQGRVWIGTDAKDRGLVDEMGGLDAAVAAIRKQAKIADSERVRLIPYPPKRSLLDQLLRSSNESVSIENRLAKKLGINLDLLTQNGFLHLMPFQLEFR